MIKAVIFDMDGVIINSEPFWKEADIKVYKKVGLQLNEEMCSQTTGLNTRDAIAYWKSRYPWNSVSDDELKHDIESYVTDCIHKRGQAMPGLDYILHFFEQRNIKMAIASASAMDIIEAVLEKLQLHKHFMVYHSSEFEVANKPHPAVYITTAKKLGIAPQHCLVFEDSINGLKAGKAANMKVIAIPDGHLKNDHAFLSADAVLNNFFEFSDTILNKFSNS